jgi:hypothetical protein
MNRNRFILAAIAAVSLIFRALAFFRYRFDSDEPQHLHVTWGWTAGLLQYRDVFDNHAPLFHILTAPLLSLAGERATILFFMRLPMLVLWAIVLGCTYVVARRLYDARVATWSALLLSVLPPFFLKSLEYRPDNLWTAFWMLAVVALISQRYFIAGLLLGLAMATSLKSILLIATLVIAAAITRTLSRGFAVLLLGAALPPTLLAAYFWYRGAWPSVVYCLFTFNRSVDGRWLPRLLSVAALIAVAVVGRKQKFWGVATVVFFILLVSFWILPLVSPRDALPFLPFVVMTCVAAVAKPALSEAEGAADRRGQPGAAVATFAAAAAICLALVAYYADGFRNRTREFTTMMNQVIGLTRPGEWLMDLKGETIYRPRPYTYIFEVIGRQKIQSQSIPDNVPEAIVDARCYVTQADGPFFTPRTRKFLVDNFLDMGRLRAAGSLVGEDGGFAIAVPGEYVIVRDAGEARGVLDGTPYAGARRLHAGPHRFERDVAGEVVTVLWAPAFRRGYSPFHRRDREF